MAEKKEGIKKLTQDDKLFAFWDMKEQRKFARDFGKTLDEVRDASMAVGKDGKPGRSRKDIAAYLLNHPSEEISIHDITIDNIDTSKPLGKLLKAALNIMEDDSQTLDSAEDYLEKCKDRVLLEEM